MKNKTMKFPAIPVIIALCLFLMAGGLVMAAMFINSMQGGNNGIMQMVKDKAYSAFGARMYHSLRGKKYPVSAGIADDPFYISVDWDRMEAENTEKFPYTRTSSINYNGVTAVVQVFNAAYVDAIDPVYDVYFEKGNLKGLSKKQLRKIYAGERETRKRSMVHILAFPSEDAQLVYYPGKNFYRGGTQPRLGKWDKNAPKDVKSGRVDAHERLQDTSGLLALFNGVFYREDDPTAGQAFGYDVRFKPGEDKATAAIYNDGTFVIKKYSDLKDKEYIHSMIQCRDMILQNGKPMEDAKPDRFHTYGDNVVRSYIFKKGKRYFGYMWTTYMPQEVAARIAMRMGITDMMLLDIHSVINCAVAKPGKEGGKKDMDLFRKNSFNFVPSFSETQAYYGALKASEALGRPIQEDLVYAAFKGSANDFFAVFAKDSPEAKRMVMKKPVSAKNSVSYKKTHPKKPQKNAN